MPRLTIICPTVGRNSLTRTLASIKGQLSQGDEFILAVDGIADDWIREQWAKAGLPGRLVEVADGPHKDWGHSVRNRVLHLVRDGYVLHIDDDDEFMWDSLKNVRQAIDECGEGLYLFRFRYSDGRIMWDEPKLELGRIGTPMFCHPVGIMLGTWTGHYGGDFDFIKATRECNPELPLNWRQEIITLVNLKFPTTLKFRDGTHDLAIWKAVFEANEYRLPERLNGAVVIDIGAHTGSFAALCRSRGASEIYSVEADWDNLQLAMHNVHQIPGESLHEFRHAAAWRSDVRGQRLRFTGSGDANTGCGRVLDGAEIEVPPVSLDSLIREAGYRNGERFIDWLKLDCEGGEWPILFTSQRLQQVRNIVGELHLGTIPDLPESARIEGVEYSLNSFRDLLARNGFTTEFTPVNDWGLCLFFARS